MKCECSHVIASVSAAAFVFRSEEIEIICRISVCFYLVLF